MKFKVLVYCLFCKNLHGETILNFNNVKTQEFRNHLQKRWFLYIGKFLSKSMKKHYSFAFRNTAHEYIIGYVKKAIRSSETLQNISKSVKLKIREKDQCNTTYTVTYPLGGLRVQENTSRAADAWGRYQFDCISAILEEKYSQVHSSTFQLDSHLRINITFHNIKILIGNFYSCYIGNLAVKSSSQSKIQFEIYYCGMISNVISYPPFKSIEIVLSLRPHVWYEFSASYAAIDSNIITSMSHENFTELKPQWFVYLLKISIYIQCFSIMTEKYKTINFIASNQRVHSGEIYDGPGTLSPVLQAFSQGLNELLYNSTSFQCTLYVYKSASEHLYHLNIQYYSKFAPINRDVFPNTNDTVYIDYPTGFCKKVLCVQKITASLDYKMVVSINEIRHNYLETNSCNYGGIAVYSINNKLVTKVSTTCLSKPNFHKYRNIYSNSPQILLVIYSYGEYGKLSLSVTLTTTQCSHMFKSPCFSDCYFGTKLLQPCNILNTEVSLNLKNNRFQRRWKLMYITPDTWKCVVIQYKQDIDILHYSKLTVIGFSSADPFMCGWNQIRVKTSEIDDYTPSEPIQIKYYVSGFFADNEKDITKNYRPYVEISPPKHQETNVCYNLSSASTRATILCQNILFKYYKAMSFSSLISSSARLGADRAIFKYGFKIANVLDWVDIMIDVQYLSDKQNIFDELYPNEAVDVSKITTSGHSVQILSQPDEGILVYLRNGATNYNNSLEFDLSMKKTRWHAWFGLNHKFGDDTVMSYADLQWRQTLQLSSRNPHYFIILPGIYTSVQFHKHEHVSYNSAQLLKIYWVQNTLQRRNFTTEQTKLNCTWEWCAINYHITDTQGKIYYGYLLPGFCWFCKISKQLRGSWNEAFELCKSAGGSLPTISSKDDQEKLISLLAVEMNEMQMGGFLEEVVFIGLRHSFSRGNLAWIDGNPASFQLWNNINYGKTSITSYQVMLGEEALPHFNQRYNTARTTSNLIDIKNKSTETLFPQTSIDKCGVLLLTNIAEPEWITVNCDEPIGYHAICVFQTNSNISSSQKKHVLHRRSCVIRYDICYIFRWITDVTKNTATTEGNLQVAKNEPNFYQFLFDAVSVNFPPIISPDFQFSQTVRKIANIYSYAKHNIFQRSFQGLYIVTEDSQHLVGGGNLHKCNNNTYISKLWLCDGKGDCPEENPSDEDGCVCHESKRNASICKFLMANTKCYFASSKGRHSHCQIFKFDGLSEAPAKKGEHIGSCSRQEIFNLNAFKEDSCSCNDLKNISVLLLNDLVPDCSGAEDELFLKYTLQDKTSFTCKTKGQIPCQDGHPLCYNISEICTYKLNALGYLIPCRTGNHLQSCHDFECNMMFKCPGYYCIPWSYTCDGKWDCPNGLDESETQGCGSARSCASMYKCVNSQICAHTGDICDNQRDCPYGDDEELCKLHNVFCPPMCECLTFTIGCHNLSLPDMDYMLEFPYHAIFIKNSDTLATMAIVERMSFNTLLILPHNSLTSICEISAQLAFSLQIDFGFNLIVKLQKACFKDLHFLKILQLNNNLLSGVKRYAFQNLSSLEVLDLSRNYLLHLSIDIVSSFSSLQLINILHITSLTAGNDALMVTGLKIIVTDKYWVCCLAFLSEKCVPKNPWHKLCSDLLSTKYIKVMCYFSQVTIVVSIISIVLQRLSIVKKLDKSGAFGVSVSSVNLSDIIYSLYLTSLWATDLVYGHEFPAKEIAWRSSFNCFVGFALSLEFHIISPMLLFMLSLSRLMVVVHPLDTRFKEVRFVTRITYAIYVFSLLLSISATSVAQTIYKQLPHKFCSPFIDPTHSFLMLNIAIWLGAIYSLIFFVLILVTYIKLVKELKASQKKLKNQMSKRKSDKPLIAQIIILISSNFLCWIPSYISYLMLMFGDKYPTEIADWVTVAIVSINSIIHSFVFVIISLRKLCCSETKPIKASCEALK